MKSGSGNLHFKPEGAGDSFDPKKGISPRIGDFIMPEKKAADHRSDGHGSVNCEYIIHLDISKHGITDPKTQQTLKTQGPTLEIMQKHKLFKVALFLLEQYQCMNSSQASGKGKKSSLKFLVSTVQTLHEMNQR